MADKQEAATPLESVTIFLRGLRSPADRWATIREFLTGIAALVAFFYALTLVIATGQILAVGLTVAFKKYGMAWLSWPAYSAAIFFFGLGGFLLGIEIVARLLARGARALIKRQKPKRTAEETATISKTIGSTIGGTTLFAIILLISYAGAKESYKAVTNADQTIGDSKKTLSTQSQTVAKLSDSALELIKGLDATGAEVLRAKNEVSATLVRLTAQQTAIQEATKKLAELAQEQESLQLQHAEVERIFQGRYVPTRDEISRGNYVSQALAFVFGIVSSIVASVIFDRWTMRRKKREATLEQPKSDDPPMMT